MRARRDLRAPRRRSARLAALGALLAAGVVPAAASATTYYVAPGGHDHAAGTSPRHPWASLDRIQRAALRPGDRVLLRRGGRWRGSLRLARGGRPGAPVTLGAYGTGPRPVIANGGCVTLSGTYQVVTGLELAHCTRAGIFLSGTHGTVVGNYSHDNISGVEVDGSSSRNLITRNQLIDNNRLANPPSSGAFGILLNGDDNVVSANIIRGSYASSPVYGEDGSAVEVYKGRGNLVTRNLAIDNLDFSELGDSRSADNTYSFNVVRSSRPHGSFLVTRGGGQFGPVRGTRLINNTVYMPGAQAQGFVCDVSCDSGILVMRNNIIWAHLKAGYSAGRFDEDNDLFFGGIRQFTLGRHSRVANPRWVDPARGDFRLRPGSPAIGRGADVGVQVDFTGRRIRAGRAPDLGAIAYAPGQPPARVPGGFSGGG